MRWIEEAKQERMTRRGAARQSSFDARDDIALGAGEAGAFDVGGVTEKC